MTDHKWVKFSFGRGKEAHETYLALRELGYLVVLELEFNTDTQEYEGMARRAEWRDT